jgi:hypothetical protein
MLEEPDRAWKLTELAEATDASLGQTYKVSEKLVDEAFAWKSWVDVLDLHTVELGGNVHLLRPYDEGVFYGLRRLEGTAVVGNIQLYLDLYQISGARTGAGRVPARQQDRLPRGSVCQLES